MPIFRRAGCVLLFVSTYSLSPSGKKAQADLTTENDGTESMNPNPLVRGGFKKGSQMQGTCGKITDPDRCIKENRCYWSDLNNIAQCLPATDLSVRGNEKPKPFVRVGKTNVFQGKEKDA